jgi:hypothetical protein
MFLIYLKMRLNWILISLEGIEMHNSWNQNKCTLAFLLTMK